MPTLIFDYTLTGHHLEYLNYLYRGAVARQEEQYVFAVPEKQWLKVRDNCVWPESDNVRWIMLDDDECKNASSGSMFSKCRKLSRLIKNTAVRERVDRIKLISLAEVIPVLPLILPAGIKVSGIIYKIYLRAPKKGIRKWIDYARYTTMACSGSVERVFILNDPRSADELNKIYHTDKFIPLADPIPEPDMSQVKDLRQELGIPASAKVFLHFGAMDGRKGTIEIVKAINELSTDELGDRYFIFAGKVNSGIREEFYNLYDRALKKGAHVIVRDEFCPYETLFSLCYSCDCILIPYTLTDLSSGVLGYAALFHKPVIGPSAGLIGELITRYNLGLTLPSITPTTIAEGIRNPQEAPVSNMYIKSNTIASFCDVFLR